MLSYATNEFTRWVQRSKGVMFNKIEKEFREAQFRPQTTMDEDAKFPPAVLTC
jgi:hypothetical protein